MVINVDFESMALRWEAATIDDSGKGWQVPAARPDGKPQGYQLVPSAIVAEKVARLAALAEAAQPVISKFTLRGGSYPGVGRYRSQADRADTTALLS